MPRRRRTPDVASDAGGRTYKHPPPPAGTPTTGKHQAPAGVRGPVKPKGHPAVAKAARAVGEAAVKGGHEVRRGAERDVGRVLAEADRERRAAARKERAARQAKALQKLAAPAPLGLVGGRAEQQPRREPPWIRQALSHKPITYEDIGDFAVGKAATNLVFHGDISHPGAAALELGTMLPILRPFRALKESAAGIREARAAAKAAPEVRAAIRAPLGAKGATVEPHQMSKEEFSKVNPGDWGKGTEFQKRWDATPDNQKVWLYHATTRENAEKFAKNGIDPSTKPTNLARQRYEAGAGEQVQFGPGAGLSPGFAVGKDPRSIEGYGRAIVAVRVRKGDVLASPEQFRGGDPMWSATAAHALDVNDAHVVTRIPPEDVRLIGDDARGVPLAEQRVPGHPHEEFVKSAGGGRPPGKPPTGLEPPPEGPPVGDLLPGMREAQKATVKGYKPQRAERFAKMRPAFGMAGGGEAGLNAMSGELKGELAKVPYEKLNMRWRHGEYTQAHLDSDINTIMEHPGLKETEAFSAARGWRDMVKEGVAPQARQLDHLTTVFGPETVKKAIERSFGDRAADVIGSSRALKSMLDLSVTLRQNLVLAARDPLTVARSIPKQARSFTSEQIAVAEEEAIRAHPLYDEANDIAKLSFTHAGPDIRAREEMYPSAFIERKVHVGGHNINVPGRVARASGRSFLVGRDYALMYGYEKMRGIIAARGADVSDPQVLRALGKFMNSATGRGEYKPGGWMQSAAPLLNALLFAPKLIKSRIDFLNPYWYVQLYKDSPHVAAEALQSMITLGTVVTGVLGLGYYLGGKVTPDPRSADFGKLKLGNTRLDPLGGFQQYLRLAAQLTPEKVYGGKTLWPVTVSSTTGRATREGSGFGERNPLDVLWRFGQGKASPPAGIALDLLRGSDFSNQPISVQKEIIGAVTPLIAQDVYDLYKDKKNIDMKKAMGFAMIGYLTSLWGVGMQTYHDQKPEQIKAKHDQYGQAILKAQIETGLRPAGAKLDPAVESALKYRAGRYVFREQHGGDPVSNFTADIGYLLSIKAHRMDGGVMDSERAKKAARWAHTASPDAIKEESRYLDEQYFNSLYQETLTDTKTDLTDRGKKLPKLH